MYGKHDDDDAAIYALRFNYSYSYIIRIGNMPAVTAHLCQQQKQNANNISLKWEYCSYRSKLQEKNSSNNSL
jgi:hypothetical protein